jgi:hypothetical protein
MTDRDEETDDSDRMRQLADLKETLERKITDLKSELEALSVMLEFVNQILIERGFKRAETKITPTHISASLSAADEKVLPLKTASGSLLATLHMGRDSMRVVVAEGESFSVKTPPFQQFLIERVLSKMQGKDREAVARGEIVAEKALTYELVLDGELLREIDVYNPTPDRFREIRSSVHWTLEKMREKTANNE